MLMSNYDFYDMYAVLLNFRYAPSYEHNKEIAQKIKYLLDAPQEDNGIAANLIRKKLCQTESLDPAVWNWVFAENIYTYGHRIIKDKFAYIVMSQAFEELLTCLEQNDFQHFYDLSDALHNVPIILADSDKNISKSIAAEISAYRKKWNSDFLKETLRK